MAVQVVIAGLFVLKNSRAYLFLPTEGSSFAGTIKTRVLKTIIGLKTLDWLGLYCRNSGAINYCGTAYASRAGTDDDHPAHFEKTRVSRASVGLWTIESDMG